LYIETDLVLFVLKVHVFDMYETAVNGFNTPCSAAMSQTGV